MVTYLITASLTEDIFRFQGHKKLNTDYLAINLSWHRLIIAQG